MSETKVYSHPASRDWGELKKAHTCKTSFISTTPNHGFRFSRSPPATTNTHTCCPSQLSTPFHCRPLRGKEGSPHPSPPHPILSSGVNAPSKREVFDRSSIHARPAGKRRGETHVSDRPTDARGKAGRHEKALLLLLPYITTATADGGGFRQTFSALHTLSCLIAVNYLGGCCFSCTCSSSNPIPDTLPPPPLFSLSLTHTHGPSDSPFLLLRSIIW